MTDADLDELVARVTEATSALIGGRIRRYFDLVDHADDFTPTLEVVETYASGDLAVLVVVEHQHGEIGDRPAQDWSLRVTLVFRHEGSRWRLGHRHADALVHPINFDQLAALARGAPG
jgi:ketosteroid isomerase-like protein